MATTNITTTATVAAATFTIVKTDICIPFKKCLISVRVSPIYAADCNQKLSKKGCILLVAVANRTSVLLDIFKR